MKKIIIVVLALAIVLGFLFWRFGPNFFKKDDKDKPITLTIYGLWEEENLMKPAFEAYKKQKPNVTIKYIYQSSANYQKRVQTQILNNEGPDIFMLHQTWVPVFLKSNSISAIPESVMSLDEYSKAFNPVVRETLSDYPLILVKIKKDASINDKVSAADQEFTKSGKIYAIPRGIDGLALYYNEDILKAVNVSVPKTWEEFRNAAIRTTTKDQSGNIVSAGAAMGSTGNIDHWSDIIGLLFFQQPGADLEKPNAPSSIDPNRFLGADVLKFYTDFITDPKQKVWDVTLKNSTQLFEEGKLAFYFAPSWRAHEIHTANKDLQFKIAPVPGLPDSKNISWSTIWAYAVSNKSQNQTQAWEFLKFFTSSETQKLLYQEASNSRLFGLPYSRVQLQQELLNDPLVGAFVSQGPGYKSWYLASETHDQGINDQMIKYFEDAINATLQGTNPKNALDTTAKGVEQVLDTFVSPAVPVPSKR